MVIYEHFCTLFYSHQLLKKSERTDIAIVMKWVKNNVGSMEKENQKSVS